VGDSLPQVLQRGSEKAVVQLGIGRGGLRVPLFCGEGRRAPGLRGTSEMESRSHPPDRLHNPPLRFMSRSLIWGAPGMMNSAWALEASRLSNTSPFTASKARMYSSYGWHMAVGISTLCSSQSERLRSATACKRISAPAEYLAAGSPAPQTGSTYAETGASLRNTGRRRRRRRSARRCESRA
jgi:hypothetical protein